MVLWNVILVVLLSSIWINAGFAIETDLNSQWVAQDGYIFDNNLQGSEREIPLENFFWTGSGDGPPPLQPPKPINSLNKDVFVKTSTVLATVYIDGQSPMDDDPLCVYNCSPHKSEDQKLQNSTIAYARSDRRFWLLTIVAGFFDSVDIPLVEDHLASLYRRAFTRQQAHHLGLVEAVEGQKSEVVKKQKERRKRDANSLNIRPTRVLEADGRTRVELNLGNVQKANNVRVVIHNMTHLTEAEVLQRNQDNQVDFIGPQGFPDSNSSQFTNQTELLYTVFVGNKPVLAITAADDMRLVTTEEVVRTLGSQVLTKSEPYLKEPMATPLVPATVTSTVQQDANIFYFAAENPIVFGILCAALFLLIFLLVGFLFMANGKRAHSAEIRRLQTERNITQEAERRPIQDLPKDDPESKGHDNIAFEGDYQEGMRIHSKSRRNHQDPPDIHFPLPPLHRPSSSSSATSDSSVYYNKRYRDEAKNIVSDVEPMFMKRNHEIPEKDSDTNDQIYSIPEKNKKSKARRKYLSENRVGSVEITNSKTIVEVISSPSHDTSSEVTYAAPDNYEQMDTFNLREAQKIHDRRNQQLKKALYGGVDDFEIASSVLNSPNEAVNREILKALHRQTSDQTSLDSGSIGSFLSMASLKSFPKCSVPEPLSRVLEPITITHFDQSDQDERKIHKPSSSGAYKKQIIDHFVNNEKRITRPPEGQFMRTQSEGSDPGVVGPIVWEMHKKELGKQNSPLRDPAKTRNRFEGLLEGAIRLYETSEDRELGHSRKPPTNVTFTRNPKPTDSRGRSAVVTGVRPKMGILRPVTAVTAQTDGTSSPPSPSKCAWRSGAPSPLVRPLSAGPFHRPEMNPTNSRLTPQSEAVQLSTAPLIEAIHSELRKFNRKNSISND